jgi:predicted enzyme related to lactoylglutathione lyase
MRLGEVGILTDDVLKLADFYKAILRIDNQSNDNIHQTLIAEETMLTITLDNSKKNKMNQNICLAFTVDDVDEEYKRLLDLGVRIIEGPVTRPWGARNMSFFDPDNNIIYFRSFLNK